MLFSTTQIVPNGPYFPNNRGHTLKLKRESNPSDADRGQPTVRRLDFYNGSERWSAGLINGGAAIDAHRDGYGKLGGVEKLDRIQMMRSSFLFNIRTFGYNHLKPPGIPRTMQTMLEEEEASEAEMSHNEDQDMEGGLNGALSPPDEQLHSTESEVEAVNPEVDGSMQQEDPGEQGHMDLDDAIPEASDNDYDLSGDGYDEDQYQEGFMTEDEYDPPTMDQSHINLGSNDDDNFDDASISSSEEFQSGQASRSILEASSSHDLSGQPVSFVAQGSLDLSRSSFTINAELSGEEDMSF